MKYFICINNTHFIKDSSRNAAHITLDISEKAYFLTDSINSIASYEQVLYL